MAEALLSLEGLVKSFDQTRVLDGLSLTVGEGEFVTLLGASGCGKTTTLRIIAGLTMPDAGRVVIGGEDVTLLAPEKRPVNTVFQNYALFPHMNVAKNISYGMRIKGAAGRKWKPRVRELLKLVQLEGYEKRMPSELSGGQRQRVAIARAVILSPSLLLLDEPLGALDLSLRRQMQTELKDIQKRLGISFVYITHDQEEALNMSDRIAVMRGGRIEQAGTPEDIYERPETRYVAEFIGQAALFEGTVDAGGASAALTCGQARLAPESLFPGEKIVIGVHPERLRFSEYPAVGFKIPAVVLAHRYAGSMIHTELALSGDGRQLTAVSAALMSDLPAPGAHVHVYWDERHASVIRETAS